MGIGGAWSAYRDIARHAGDKRMLSDIGLGRIEGDLGAPWLSLDPRRGIRR